VVVPISLVDAEARSAALTGLRVLDLTDDVAGQFAGRLLADHGAEVWLVEPPGGARMRGRPPFHPEDPSLSLLFAHLNLGKRSVVLDPSERSGRDGLTDLAATADVVLHGVATDVAGLRTATTGAVFVSVTDFGAGGPRGWWTGTEMVHQALSGVMRENGKLGRPPLYGCGHRSYYAAGAAAYTAVLAALYERGRTGVVRAASVEVGLTAASMNYCRTTQYRYSGMIDQRGSTKQPKAIVRCRDRWICIFPSQHWWTSTLRLLGADDLAEDPRLADVVERQRRWREIIDVFQEAVADRAADAVVAEIQAIGGVAGREFSPTELVDAPHLRERGYWEQARTAGRRLTVGGPLFRMSATPRGPVSGPPPLDGHGVGPVAAAADSAVPRPVSRDRAALEPADPRPATPPPGRPLQGVRVLDLTTEWAGPMAARLLATLGAEVIHVEAPQRMDGWRGPVGGGHPSTYPDGVPGQRPYNRSCMFNSQNTGKRSLVLDLKSLPAREAALTIAAGCDIVLTNFRTGILERLGLGYEMLCRRRPDAIVVQMPAFGSTGPLAAYGAVGPTMELAAGMASLIGYGDGEPIVTGPAYMDPIGAYNAAAACLTALVARERTGRGQQVEVAQNEAGMQWIGEQLMLAAAGGEMPVPQGNRSPWAAPHDVYPALGEDEWVVLAVTSDEQWLGLCREMDRDDLAADPRLRTVEGRLRHQDELDREIRAWTSRRPKDVTAQCLQEAGISAAPVLDGGEVAGDDHLRSRGFFSRLTHPEAGTHEYQGLPVRLENSPADPPSSAPCFGADTRALLADLAGLRPEQVEALLAAGAAVAAP
jgi:crotonobetainyl-CoA:carnitine CoA-transferase CaiB-like acyl-CoA transferase